MKIAFSGTPPVPHEVMMSNVEHAHTLGLCTLSLEAPHVRKLAVVGGGPSIAEHVLELRAWCGDIFAINGACTWLRERGIDSIFFSVDPDVIVSKWAVGAKKAILVSRTDPSAFEILKNANVTIFDLVQDLPQDGIVSGTSTATSAFHIATVMGYRDVTFFGCESSYGEKTHAYQHEDRIHRMTVKCGADSYHTAPDFYFQAQELSSVIRKFPGHFKEKSGGLLRAMIENDDHDITEISEELAADLVPIRELKEAA